MVPRTLEFLSSFLLKARHLAVQQESQNPFPMKQGKESSSGTEEGESRPLLNCDEPLRIPVEWRRYVGEFLELQQGCEPFEVQEGRRDFSQDAAVENGLISPGGENLLDFLCCSWSLSSYDRDLRDPFRWLQERPVSVRIERGPSGFLSSRCRVLKPVWSRSWYLRFPLQCWHGSWCSSKVSPGELGLVSCGYMHVRFPSSFSSSVSLPVELTQGSLSFPRDATGL